MTDGRFTRLQTIFSEAVALPPERRDAFVRDACGADDGLREEVERLLAADASRSTVVHGSVLSALATLDDQMTAPGRRLGPYVLEREIGRGGMGVVYLATRVDVFEKRVAIKLLRRGLDSEEVLARFEQERRTLARLDHPGVARLLDGGADEHGLPYFVMEYVDGVPLDRYCADAHLALEPRLRLVQRVCEAVHYAHQNLVVHRDLKPTNILVTADGIPRLLDFGIARLLREDSAPDVTVGPRMLTPAYASPEQIRGEPASTVSDVYSLGVVLYEVVSNRRPYTLDTLTGLDRDRAVLDATPLAPSAAVLPGSRATPARGSAPMPDASLARRLRGDVDVIVARAMHKAPERRYASAAELSADLDRHLTGLPVSARRDTLPYRMGKFVRRHKVTVAAAVVVAATLVAAAAISIVQAGVAQREAARARRISEYIQRVFAAADPFLGRRDVTVTESLVMAAERASKDLEREPDARAAVHRAIGTTLANVDAAAALPYLKAAYETHRDVYGERHEETLASLVPYASIVGIRGDLDQAEQLLRRAYDGSHAVLPPGHPTSTRATVLLGQLLLERGRYADADARQREARAALVQVPPSHERDVLLANAINNLAVSAYNQGHLDEAAGLYRDAIDILRKLSPTPADLPGARQNLGVIYRLRGDLAEAERLFRDALEGRRLLLGADHPNVAIAEVHLGDTLMRERRFDEARTLLDAAVALQRRVLPPGHLDLARSTAALGLLDARTAQAARGEPLLREALAIRQRVLGEGHWLTASVASALGESLTVQRRFPEAEGVLLPALDRMVAALGGAHPAAVETRERIAALYDAWGRPDRAAAFRR